MAPLSPPRVSTTGTKELPAYLSNGLIGLRVVDIPLFPGIVMVNGFSGLHPVMQIEAAANAPYPLAGDLAVNGVWLVTAPHLVEFIDQAYDFETGELQTRFAFNGDQASARVEVLTFCSRTDPTVVAQEIAVEVSAACDLTLRALVNAGGVHGRILRRGAAPPGRDEGFIDGWLAWETLGGLSQCGIAYATQFLGDQDVERAIPEWGLDSSPATDYTLRARPGRTYRLRQIASVVPSKLHSEPDRAATRLAAQAATKGFDRLRDDNRAAWAELWRGRVVIDADDEQWQRLADAAFYYLNSSVHPSAPSSTSIYGLAQWKDYHYYYGHVMWDVDLFCVPPLLFSQPEAARSLLEFRSQTLTAARENAKLHGRLGIQFPWESGPHRGEEASPGAGRASWHEDHVSLDIAWAFSQYVHATGDERYLTEKASRVIYGVADWVSSRVRAARDGYDWPEVVGIAELETPPDNDAFTIMAAKVVLGQALELAAHLGDKADPRWSRVRDGLQLRRMANGALASHDGFHPNETKGATPSPLAGLFPYWFDLDPATARRTLDYYLALAPGYIGSPMLSALYGVWASWAGDRRLATRLYEEGYARLHAGRFLQTLEMAPGQEPGKPESGPFFANLGGFLSGLVYGLPGLRLDTGDPAGWPQRPVILPAGWRSIEIEQAWVRGEPTRILARHGAARATIERPKAKRRRAA